MKPKTLGIKEEKCWLLRTHIDFLKEDRNIVMVLKKEYFKEKDIL